MRARGNSRRSAGVRSRSQRAPLISTSSTPAIGASRRRSAYCSISTSWLGTATSSGAAPACSVASARGAEKRSCSSAPAPVHRPSSAPNKNSECDMRPGASTRVAAAGPKSRRLTRKLSAQERWWRMKPLGRPVLPEVKPM